MARYQLLGYINPVDLFPTAVVSVVGLEHGVGLLHPDGTLELEEVNDSLQAWGATNSVKFLTLPSHPTISSDEIIYALGEDDLLIGNADSIARTLELRLAFWAGSPVAGMQLARVTGNGELVEQFSARVRRELANEEDRLTWDAIQREDPGQVRSILEYRRSAVMPRAIRPVIVVAAAPDEQVAETVVAGLSSHKFESATLLVGGGASSVTFDRLEELRRSAAVVLLLSPVGMLSPAMQIAFQLARALARRPPIGLIVSPCEISEAFRGLRTIDATSDLLRAVAEVAVSVSDEPSTPAAGTVSTVEQFIRRFQSSPTVGRDLLDQPGWDRYLRPIASPVRHQKGAMLEYDPFLVLSAPIQEKAISLTDPEYTYRLGSG